jgi:hypothetical protein
MFAKVFSQIFDSSIADDYLVRHVFIDFLILADRHGVVDMTVEAIARRTNVPEEMVRRGIERLTQPDKSSRSHVEEGRRLVLLDSHREWGWQIVNYQHYRNIVDEESRKAYFRDKQRAYRSKPVKDVSDNSTLSKEITHADADADADTEARVKVPCPERLRASVPPPEDMVIGLPLNDKTLYWIQQPNLDRMKELYPAVDVMQQLRNMVGWIEANPARRKTRRGIARFINAWLAKEQDHGRRIDNGNGQRKRTGLDWVSSELRALDSKLAD